MSFDAIARVYRFVEALVFGRALQRARTAWIEDVRDARRALIVGEGDGRFLEQLLRVAPAVHVDCLDASATMLEIARARVRSERVTFVQADLATYVPAQRYDLVVTHFVLDCFPAAAVATIVAQLATALERDGRWLIADFRIPDGAVRSRRARFWLVVLYGFFRVVAGLRVTTLVDPTPLLRSNGLARVRWVETDAGFLGSALWRRT
ncbi:MAG: class I SAM-dependent methyltransferase [Polyangia bacterium]